VFTLKPIDRDAVEHYARSTGAIVTAENHSIYNGLGSAVAEVVAETCPVPLERVGVLDRFGQVGTVDYLREIYQLDAKTIYEKARKAIARKNQ
jgi:transketolase